MFAIGIAIALGAHTGCGEWKQMGNDIEGEAQYDESGGSVSLSNNGNIIAIGAIYNDGNGKSDSGHTRGL